jgi:hypothetical protein
MLARVARRLRRRGDSSRGRLVGMMAVRNESWVLGLTLRAALEYCDAVVVTDHRSTDDSVRILEEMRAQSRAGAIHLERSQQAEWMEMDERQAMLDRARAIGGTHFVIVDADELPTANLLPKLKRWALDTPPGQFLSLPMVSPWHALDVRRTDGVWGDLSRVPWCFADAPEVAYAKPGAHQLHRRVPQPLRDGGLLVAPRAGGMFHLQFADAQRLVAKAVWYKMIETLRYPGRRSAAELNSIYDWTLQAAGARLAPVPAAWWEGYRARGWLAHLRIDTPAWQRAEVVSLLERHGRSAFAGIDFHGLG